MVQPSLTGIDNETARSFKIVFDGGSRGNPGHGYGSYQISTATGPIQHQQLDFADRGNRVTNNQAEYLTLIGALNNLVQLCGDHVARSSVAVYGDSMLVIMQLLGKWKVKKVELQPLHAEAVALLKQFGSYTLTWHDRRNSVEILGH
jgi:ribonuclease HI